MSLKVSLQPMSETLKPIGDNLVVTDEKTVMSSVLEVIDSRPSNLATVLAVGEGRVLKNGKRAPMIVKPGDRVLLGRYAGFRYELADTTVRLLSINDVQAIL